MTDRSIQEKFVRELSSHLIGDQSVFKPQLYRHGEEPADLVWVTGRCAVIVNATSSKRSLNAMREHNNSQMHRWLRRWKRGEVLNGPNLSISFADVDFIVGISIVGGNNARSSIEDEQVLYAHSKGHTKLCACATLTDKVFERLCKRSVGLRDLIDFLEYLRARCDIVSDQDAIDWLDYWEDHHAAEARRVFGAILPHGESLNDAWLQTKLMLYGLKKETSSTSSNQFLSDLSFSDAIWLSVAERALSLQIARPGEFGHVLLGSKRRVGETVLSIFVAAHMGKVTDEYLEKMIGDGLTVISTLELGPEAPIRLLVANSERQGRLTSSLLQNFRDGLVP